MRLTIIRDDKIVYKDGVSYNNLHLGSIPENVHALQWHSTSGWIEYNDGTVNESILELPSWANDAEAEWVAAEITVPTAESEAATLTYTQKMALIRAERNRRISLTDWTQAGDVVRAHPSEWNQAWEAYRQALRDLPGSITENNIETFTYPTPPGL